MANVNRFRAYAKFLVAVGGAAVMTAYQFLDDNALTGTEKTQVASVAVAAFLVWLTANGPKGTVWAYAKTLAYGSTALLGTLLTVLPDGISTQEKVALAIAFLTGAGVLGVRNEPETTAVVVTE